MVNSLIPHARSSLLATMVAVIAISSMSACDSAPGARDLQESAPVVSGLSFTPGSISLDAIPPEDISGGSATVSLQVVATVTDEDDDASSLYIFVLPPDGTSDTAGEKTVALSGDGRITTQVELTIPTAEVGVYTVKVYASDVLGQLGNQATGSLEITASSEPPVIDSIDIPATIVRPGVGQPPVQIPIVLTASDPDGLANILRVEMLVNGSGPLFLCDDGNVGICNVGFPTSGDLTAADGNFTITIQLSSDNAEGQNTFAFKVIDRSGLESATEERIVEVQ